MSEYLNFLDSIASSDVDGLKQAEKSYGDSWKRRGGVGAFMMLARKWDRLEKQVSRMLVDPNAINDLKTLKSGTTLPYDIFRHIEDDQRPEGVIDDVRDLRRYLLLVEAEMMARGAESATSSHRDNS